MTVRFTVVGLPQPAGSKRGFYRGGKVVVTDANAKSRPWKALVSDAALQAVQTTGGQSRILELAQPLEGPLSLQLTFHMPRPKSHYGARGLRPSAPSHPTVKPDVLKLARAVEDALTGIVYRDDAQIVTETLEKRYGEPARVEVTVDRMQPDRKEQAA